MNITGDAAGPFVFNPEPSVSERDSPNGFDCDQGLRDQAAKQNQYRVEQLAMKNIQGYCHQNCIGAYRAAIL